MRGRPAQESLMLFSQHRKHKNGCVDSQIENDKVAIGIITSTSMCLICKAVDRSDTLCQLLPLYCCRIGIILLHFSNSKGKN